MKGTHMRLGHKARFSAALLLGAAMISSAASVAFAQGEVVEDEEVVELEDAEPVEDLDCVDELECESGTEAAPVEAPPSSGPVLLTPGSTDESNPGGSTRPGTTPDT
jgi:hypothetical protein